MPVLPALLLAWLAASSDGIVVLARDADGFGDTGEAWTPERATPIPIPYLSRSEVVQRVTPTSRGVTLQLRCDGAHRPFRVDRVRVRAVEHASDAQVLVSTDATFLVGPPTLPELADPELLPLVARQDGVRLRGVLELALRPPGDADPMQRLVVLGAAPRSATILAADTKRLRIDGEGIDQLFLADTILVTDSLECPMISAALANIGVSVDALRAVDGEGVVLSAGSTLELAFAPPETLAFGRTLTLLVDLDAVPGEVERTEGLPFDAPAQATPTEWRRLDVESDRTAVRQPLVHLEGPDEQSDIRPTMGPGLAWGDVDADGWMDLYLVQGGGRDGSAAPSNRLLANRTGTSAEGSRPERSTFEDITERSRTGDTGRGMGALFLDVEGDADVDLYVANYGADVLFLNDGAGRFADASAAAGVGGDLWSAGIAAGDTDLDGDLDLYVTSYLDYDLSKMPPADDLARYQREDPVEMLPFAFPGARNVFLRNDTWRRTEEGLARGPVRFTDVTAELGLLDVQGRGMQPVFWDFDRDGDLDLYVANDVSYNVLYRNEGDGTFKDVSFASGMDDPRGGMGVAIGDVDLDGDEDLFLTNWELEPNALYLNNLVSHTSQKSRVATFRDAIVASGLGPHGIGATGWGAEFLDADNDGDLDLYVANGYTSPDYESTGICVGQPDHFFVNDGRGVFTRRYIASSPADPLAGILPSRSAVACDFDRDGDLDLALTANNSRAQLLINEARTGNHWLVVRLRGRTPNPFGIGAEVTLRRAAGDLRRSLRAGTSYLGGNPAELHFGIGSSASIEELVVRWPSGRESRHASPGVDRYVVLEEPE